MTFLILSLSVVRCILWRVLQTMLFQSSRGFLTRLIWLFLICCRCSTLCGSVQMCVQCSVVIFTSIGFRLAIAASFPRIKRGRAPVAESSPWLVTCIYCWWYLCAKAQRMTFTNLSDKCCNLLRNSSVCYVAVNLVSASATACNCLCHSLIF